MSDVRTTKLPSGTEVPVLGQGTWGWAEDAGRRANEIASLRRGLRLGLSLVDTAELYADGGAEKLVGEAIAGRRNEVFLVSKVLPSNATRDGTVAACERSLRRLGTDWLDLYLLHWRGRVPLTETVAAFEDLVAAGKIRHWGVSNFDPRDMAELATVSGGDNVATDQVLYNLASRGIEWDLLPECQKRQIPVMAYSPLGHGRLLQERILIDIAIQYDVRPAQVALAWVLRQDGVSAIPRASTPAHVEQNRAALELQLSKETLEELDLAFPPSAGPVPLEVL
ncbi:MAG TPA: aldo/keto reductase [Kribbella sp.]|jgi:diketogulonate reductase-like aldo/keto reductase